MLPTSIQICKNIAKKSPENEIWIKGYNSWNSWSIVTKVEVDV